MTAFVFRALGAFRPVFPRSSTWLFFCMVVLGFLCATDMIGISSFCRLFGIDQNGYLSLLHFFRSAGWSVAGLYPVWEKIIFSQANTIMAMGRAVFIGDHTYVPKDGRRMPGVVTLRQNSETQTKPSYFRGHCWGAVAVLVGTIAAPFCLPLVLALHLGQIHIGKTSKKQEDRLTLGTQIVQTAIDIAIRNNLPSILILDAYFPSRAVFQLAASVWSIELKEPLVTLIIRAKKNYAAYFPAEKKDVKHAGRPATYGLKVKVMEMFDHIDFFSKVTCRLYGKTEEVLLLSIDLLWKPTGSLIKFVFAMTSRGPIVLMCSDLTIDPVVALELYCLRMRVEGMIDMLKNLIGAFRYRFWTTKMPLCSRKPKRNKKLTAPAAENIPTVKLCWEAYERFAMMGAIALGLLQMIALKYTDSVWAKFDGFLRTRSRALPSERTVRIVIMKLLITNFHSLAPAAILREIRDWVRLKKRSRKRS